MAPFMVHYRRLHGLHRGALRWNMPWAPMASAKEWLGPLVGGLSRRPWTAVRTSNMDDAMDGCMDAAMAWTMDNDIGTRGHGIVHEPTMDVRERCHGPCHGRRFVHGLYHDTVDGHPWCLKWSVPWILTELWRRSCCTVHDSMVAPVVHVHGINHGHPYHVPRYRIVHRWLVDGVVHG